ncbi:hypothetical protein BCR44DRAFT_1424053, partial [Catenaria anguillulae PL171]
AGAGSSLTFGYGFHHDEDPLSVNPFAQENPFADLPSSSSAKDTAALDTALPPLPASPERILHDPHADPLAVPSLQAQDPQAAEPEPTPTIRPSHIGSATSNAAPAGTAPLPLRGGASPVTSRSTAAAFSPRIRSGVSSPSLRRSMSALAVQVDPLLNPDSTAPVSRLSLATASNQHQQQQPTTTVTSPLTAQASIATSTRTLPGTPAHPASATATSVTPPNLFLANGSTSANPLTSSLPRPASASVPPTPTTPSGTRKRAPLSFSQAQLLVPSLSASPFTITVSDPTKVGDTISPFVVYKVVTKTTQPGFKAESFVSRRYSEFLWLAGRLAAAYPGVVIPGLPEKQALGRFQEDFVEHRRVGLQLFLRKVAAHPVLNQADAFRHFVEMDQLDPSADAPAPSASSSASANAKLPLMHQDIDPYFESRRRTLDHHFHFGDTVQMFAEIEPPATLGGKLEKLGELHKRARDIVYAMAALDLGQLEGCVEEQLRTVGAIRAAMAARAAAHAHWLALDASKQKKLGLLKKSKFEQPQVKAELDELEAQVHAAQDRFDVVSGTLRGELDRLDVDRVHEVTIALQAMTMPCLGISRMANLWEDFLETMRA